MAKLDNISVLGERVHLMQAPKGLRTSIDSVLLAAACPARAGQSVLDLGCGVGSAGLCVLDRVPDTTLCGIDIQDNHIALAVENAALNHMQDRTAFVTACVRANAIKDQMFDHVICNPPYMDANSYIHSPEQSRDTALGHTHEVLLEDWINAALQNLKQGGSLTIIHRADMLDRILQSFGKRFGATELIPLWPKAGQPAKRIIVRTIRNRKSPMKIHPGLILHDGDGSYTAEAENILRQAAALY